MSIDFAVSIAVLLLSAIILHFKSHVKYIGLGLFVGLVLAETVAVPIFEFLAENFSSFNKPYTINIIQLLLLLLPTFILGMNHAVDKRFANPIKTLIYVGVITLFMASCVLSFLPATAVQAIQSRSIVAFELIYLRNWLLVATAILIIVDSFHHKHVGGVERKKKGK